MRLTPWETDRLIVFGAPELARRHRAAGLPLNHPEAVALIVDAMLEAARAGGSLAEVEAAGRSAVRPGDVMAGVRELLDEVRAEVLLGDGTRLVVLVDLLGPAASERDGPGAIRPGPAHPTPGTDGRERRSIEVRSTSRRAIRISSHHPFDRVNHRLEFGRAAAAGYRLDLPAGDSKRWEPGETTPASRRGRRSARATPPWSGRSRRYKRPTGVLPRRPRRPCRSPSSRHRSTGPHSPAGSGLRAASSPSGGAAA